MSKTPPVRVLHALASLNRGGIETWLMNVYRHLDREQIQFDFFFTSSDPGTFGEEARDLGARFYFAESLRQPWRFVRSLQQILEKQRVPVVHSHLFRFSGLVVRTAASAGVPVRISHGHTGEPDPKTWHRPLYKWLTHRWLWKHSTHGLGNSAFAMDHLFGPAWKQDDRFCVLPYGFDFSRFGQQPSRDEAKQALGIAPDRHVVGNVGRMIPIKNHDLLLRAFAALRRRDEQAHLLLVGDGVERPAIEQQVRALDLEDHCTFAGEQNDVAPFLAAMDVKCFPSFREGFGIVALEAQAIGVPVVMSETIPTEVEVVPELLQRVALDADPEVWAEALHSQIQRPRADVAEVNRRVTESEYGIETCIRALSEIYLSPGV